MRINEKSSSVFNIALAAFAGAATMFFLDPRLGHRRRVLFRDRTRHLGRQSFNFARGTLVDLAQRGRGLRHEIIRAFRNEPVSEDILVARVRSTLGHFLPSLHLIEVSAKGDEVTVSGPCDDLDIPEAIRLIGQMAGVGTVHNHFQSTKRPTEDARRFG